jgi:subtilisin family serine protease
LLTRLVVVLAVLAAAVATPALAFDDTEPFAAQQWYLTADRAWDFWPTQPKLVPVRVAVIDSGVDGGHPDLAGRVVAAKSFVGGSALQDSDGHGTFVAGEIAANPVNGIGIAGLAFNAQLLIAKVVTPDGEVSLEAEVQAIHWAVDHGARVINLSLGGVRDPFDKRLDTYSPLEQAAIDYAYSKGVVVVAAVGNGPQSPRTPWPFAHYPAALPHVIGVSAIRRDGSVPKYSNRDAVYNDLAAPGDGIFSTIPRELMTEPTCPDGPYSSCGTLEFRDAIGTSFAAPQVAAAAALLLGQVPTLRPDQVAWLLERTADDEDAADGCSECATGRDAFTGWGRLDILNALTTATDGTPLPRPDTLEPNDDAGTWSHALPPLPRTVEATLDYWDDDVDVYRVALRAGQTVYARLTREAAGSVSLALWKPGTGRLEGAPASSRVAVARIVGGQLRLGYRAPVAGTYYVEAKLEAGTQDPLPYRLAVARSS